MILKDSFEKLNPEKKGVKIYKVEHTWMYGHKDYRTWDIVSYLGSQDMWLSNDITDEIKASGFNLRDPKLIGCIVACWNDPNNKGKRKCEIFS